MNEDDFIDDAMYWQDALESVQAGRSAELHCPFCHQGVIVVTSTGRLTRLECARCHHFIEGQFREEPGG